MSQASEDRVKDTLTEPRRTRRISRLRLKLRDLYQGRSPAAIRFRLAVIGVDLALIAFFIATPFLRKTEAFLAVDSIVAFILTVDILARALASDLKVWLRQPATWLDLFVLATLLAPLWLFNFAFLRVLRIWTLFHSEFFWETVGRRYDDTRWEDVARAAATLVTFIFIATGFVYASYAGSHPMINSYVDALYFTAAALTTTGFGDITLPGAWGKLISIFLMFAGITLLVRMVQPLFRPYKVRFQCPTCSLMSHDPDAVYCKACGTLVNIRNEG